MKLKLYRMKWCSSLALLMTFILNAEHPVLDARWRYDQILLSDMPEDLSLYELCPCLPSARWAAKE